MSVGCSHCPLADHYAVAPAATPASPPSCLLWFRHRTWLKYAERRRHKATRLSAAQAALGRLKLARLLPAWQEATAQQQLKRQQVQLAQEHYTVQLLGRMVTGWQEAASAAVVERLQLVAAAELHRLRLLAACWRGLVRYARWVRCAMLCCLRSSLIGCALLRAAACCKQHGLIAGRLGQDALAVLPGLGLLARLQVYGGVVGLALNVCRFSVVLMGESVCLTPRQST